MARRNAPEINAGSMADIAFLLLIFFLVTTTMDVDTGLTRKLPPPIDVPPEDIPEVKMRNVFVVLANANDDLLVEGEPTLVSDLRRKAKDFIIGDANNENMPEFVMKNIPALGGQYPVSKQIVSLQNDRGTSYELYIKVQNELVGAYNDVRNEFSMRKFGKSYAELEELAKNSEGAEQQLDAVKDVYPQRISEAEPKDIGDQ
ncbi:biopolymer transporter ExbD [Vicingaceae bacterium]|jgi:biopolymer transport protein ExbD|nr:biopolymer transporter ExbD [Vicingaceae bacterium]